MDQTAGGQQGAQAEGQAGMPEAPSVEALDAAMHLSVSSHFPARQHSPSVASIAVVASGFRTLELDPAPVVLILPSSPALYVV
jgi:hypothetical protein